MEVRPTPTADPNQSIRRCWRCQSTNHLAKDCPQGRESRPPTRYSDRVQIAPDEGQAEGQPQADSACNRVMCDTKRVVNVIRMPVTVPRNVIFQVEAGDVADAAVADSTVELHDVGDVCDGDCLGMSDSVLMN